MKRLICAGLAAFPLVSCSNDQAQTPNVIFILADDLGYGDLSCYGQQKFLTPNIDRLASEGKLFTQHYAGTSVSAPSRCSFITGLHTGHTQIRGNKELPQEGQYPIAEGTNHLFRFFKDNGYSTGVFGKWGLGAPSTEGAPENQQVDEFYGYNCQRMAHNYYPRYLWHNGEKVILEGNTGKNEGEYAPYLIHAKALDFIRRNESTPFFIWYTTTIPHAELRLPEAEMESLTGNLLLQPEKSYEGCDDGPEYKTGGYGSQAQAHTAFASMITLLDRQVGEISDLLDSLGIADNTILVFTSDNGPHREGGADPEFFNSNGGLRGFKRDVYEGGIRVPFIIRWPGHIEAGVTDHISAFWDFFPTVADILGKGEIPGTDGISYLPTLTGNGVQQEHEYMYWEFHEDGGRQAVRKGDWKAVRNNVVRDGDIELYNLRDDISETRNLAGDYPDKVMEFESIMKSARTESDLFKFRHKAYEGDK